MKFFNLTNRYKEMILLEYIEKHSKTTQKKMAELAESSISMTNNYIDKLEENNYIKREYISSKVVYYHITPKGIKRKNFLQITYMKELMDQYVKGQKSVSHFLETIKEKGMKKVILYGAGEVAEIILDIINTNNLKLEVLCIIDDDEDKIDTTLKGIKICTLSNVENINHDGIIITSYTFEEDILKKLRKENYPNHKIVRYFNVKESNE